MQYTDEHTLVAVPSREPMNMKRVLVVLLGLVLLASLAAGAALSVTPRVSGHVYMVDEVQSGLRQAPATWVGRTVQIRAQDGHDSSGAETLVSAVPRTQENKAGTIAIYAPPLIVTRRAGAHIVGPDATTSFFIHLSHVPLLGRLVPADRLRYSNIYRVRLLDPHDCVAGDPRCPQGELQ